MYIVVFYFMDKSLASLLISFFTSTYKLIYPYFKYSRKSKFLRANYFQKYIDNK